jgi:hypothetical protein
VFERDRRPGGDPVPIALGNPAAGLPQRLAHGRPVGVQIEAHVLPALVPDLVETGIEVEKCPHRNSLKQPLVAQHAGDVEQQIGIRRELRQLLKRHADGLIAPLDE